MHRLALAWIHVRAQLGQLVAAVLVIALGVGLAGGLLLANAALLENAQASSAALAGRADLQVRTVSGGSLEQALVDTVRSVSGVKAAAPLLLGSVALTGAPGKRVAIVGVDLLDDATVRVYRSAPASGVLDDPLLVLSQPDSALAPAAFTRSRGLSLGDAIEVDAPSGRTRLVIRGAIDDVDVGRAFGGEFIVMDLESAQNLLATPDGVSQVDVLLDPSADATATLTALRAALPQHVVAERLNARQSTLEQTVAGLGLMLNAIAAMGLALGALITANRLATLYQQRSWEIGVLRGMGWTPGRLFTDLVLEAMSCSAIAVLLGLPLAFLMARVMVQPVADLLSLNFSQTIAVPTVTLRPLPLLLAALAGLSAGTAAAAWPAYRATRASIATLGAKRRGRDPEHERGWVRSARIAMPLLAGALVLLAGGSGAVSGCTMGIIALSGALLLRPLLHMVGWPIGWLLGPVTMAGLRDQSRAPSRPIAAAGVLMVGLALVVWIAATGASFERFVVDTNMRTRRGDLIVDGTIDTPATGENEPRLSDDLVPALSGVPGVELVGAETYATSHDPEVGVVGVDAVRLTTPRFADWSLEPGAPRDALERVARGEAVLADGNFVKTHGLHVGDQVRLTSPSGNVERPLAGITKPTFVSPAGDVVMARSVYREAWRDPTIHRAFVLISPDASVEHVREQILARLGTRYRLRVTDMQAHAGWVADSVRRGFAFSDAMALITLLVVLIGTGDAFAANASERTRDIGTLRAMGYTPGDISRMVLAQALAVGVSGAVLAVIVGTAMSALFVTGVLPEVVGWQLKLYPTYGIALAVALLGVLASVLGALFPAIRAGRVPIATALRHN